MLPVSLMCIAWYIVAQNYILRPSNLIYIWIWKELRKETAAQLCSILERFRHVCSFYEKQIWMWRNALSLPMIRSSICCWNPCHFLSINCCLNICLKAETLLSKQSGNSQQIIDTALFLPLFTPWVFFSDVLSCRYTKHILTGKTKFVFGNWTIWTMILT